MATAYQIRQLQRAINDFNTRYRLGQPHIPVDSVYGSQTASESKWDQWVLGFRDDQVGHWDIESVIKWLFHPSLYFATHPGGYLRHVGRLKSLRSAKPAGDVAHFDGHPIPGWTLPILTAARDDGAQFTVTSGYRSIAEQWYLYLHPEGYPVAYPGTSHHNGYRYPDGAVDLDPGQQAFSDWLDAHPKQARGLTWARDKDRVHFSVPGSHHSGEADY